MGWSTQGLCLLYAWCGHRVIRHSGYCVWAQWGTVHWLVFVVHTCMCPCVCVHMHCGVQCVGWSVVCVHCRMQHVASVFGWDMGRAAANSLQSTTIILSPCCNGNMN